MLIAELITEPSKLSELCQSQFGCGLHTYSRDVPCQCGTQQLQGSFAMQVLGATPAGWGEEGRMVCPSEDKKAWREFWMETWGLSLSFKAGLGL